MWCFGLDGPRHRFIEEKPHRLVAGEYALSDQSPKQRDRGGERRHGIRRVFECVHVTLSGDGPNRSRILTSLAQIDASRRRRVKTLASARKRPGRRGRGWLHLKTATTAGWCPGSVIAIQHFAAKSWPQGLILLHLAARHQ